MKKVVLLCAAGMSTTMLVKKMQDAANAEGIECTIVAYAQADAKERASDADAILLGPQIRFAKAKVQEECPNVPVDSIDMKIYGRMDGKGAFEVAKKLMGM